MSDFNTQLQTDGIRIYSLENPAAFAKHIAEKIYIRYRCFREQVWLTAENGRLQLTARFW